MTATGRERTGIGVLVTATGADAIAFGVILPALPFIVIGMHGGAFELGVLLAAAGVATLVAAPVWGALADRYGTRLLLLIAPLVAAGGHVIFAFSTNYPTLFAGRVVAGLGAAVVLLAQAHAARLVTDADRAGVIGRVSAAQGIGNIIGPALGGLVLSYGTVAVGLTAAAGPLVAWLLTVFLLPATAPKAAAAGRPRRLAAAAAALRSRRLRGIAAAICVGWLCFTGYAAVLPVELADRLAVTASTYGVVIAISGVVAVVVRGLLLGRLVTAFGETRLMVGGASLIAASMLLAPVVPTVWLVPVLPLTWALGASVLFPCTVAEMSRLAGPESVGLAMGAAATLSGIGSVAGPLVAGTVREFVWAPGPFVAGAALMLAVAALVGFQSHDDGADPAAREPAGSVDVGSPPAVRT
ncbi:MFS transporter [Polymorphospora rubra]|uniref:Tetracycline resistance MFS efflux pump n=1 Tax=Polymorphospora rubra TaxID=338584 RepID=A0A810MY62_9ACTN|nr:MFS transporter [Polymorphospora rubra]BCJ64909.1 tetracycline resistance MFS efflux pump [Polymorphospora rubra]